MADQDEERVSSVLTNHTEDQMESALCCKDTSKRLESSIFNHISLGQWEAARASLSSLVNDPESRENAKELLKILVLEAANYWTESPAIPSPHHLSWLALDIYQTLFPDDKDKLPPYVQDLVEFRLLLCLTRGVTSFSTRIASQLCQYHAVHVLKIPGATPDTVSSLPSISLDFIRDVITSLNPTLGHTLITSLTVSKGMVYLPNNEALQMVYIECINECLETLEQTKIPEDVENDSSYDSQYESDHPTSGARGVYKECERILSFVYTLLSMMDPTQEMVRVTKKIDRIFHTLLKSTFNVSADRRISFNAGKIYSCLLGRSTPFLINRLHEVEEYLRMNKTTTTGEESATDSTSALEVCSPAKHRSSNSNYTEMSRAEWRDRFYQALYDHKHLLENVLDTGLQLVYTGKLQELSQLMSRPEYVPLRPILLLLGWDRYSAVSSGKELLDALWPMEVSMKQSLLFNGCCKLAFQVELVQWCLEKARPHVQTPSLLSLHRAGDMFKGLETHSTLYILHHSTPLASLDPLEVIDILKMRPRVPSLSSSSTITPPPQFSRSATPMKSISDSDISPAPSPLLGGVRTFPNVNLKRASLKPEQERDIAIYRSFFAMKLVLDAIWNSVQLANGIQPTVLSPTELRETPDRETESSTQPQPQPQKQQQQQDGKEESPGSSKVARKLQLGETSFAEPQTEDATTNLVKDLTDTSSDVYEQQVTNKLQEAKVYISLIYPLNYRLEILENIFSLLFMTSEDIKLMLMDEGDGRSVAVHMKMESFSKSLSSGFSTKGRDVASMLSSIALIKSKHGYLFDERMVSDLLDMLQDCIFETRAAKYVLAQQADSAISDTSYLSHTAVRSAIPHTALQQRSAKLEQYITEARWRQQLVSSKHGITAGLGSKFKDGRNGRDHDWLSSSDDSMSEWSDSDDESNGKKEKRRTRRVGQSQQDSESGSVAAPSSQTRSESQMDMPSSKSPTVTRSPSVGTSDKYSPVPKPTSAPLPSAFTSLSSSMPAPRPLTLSPALSRTSPRVVSSPKQKRKSKQSRSKMVEGVGGSNTRSSSRQSQSSAVLKVTHDDDSGECADAEDKTPPKEAATDKRRKRLRSRGFQSTNRKRRKPILDRSESNFTRTSVVCRMLSSPGSLLRMCLKYDNYIRANQVLKMFEMEGQFGEAFVCFLEQYEQVSRELSQKSRSTIAGHKRSGSSSVTSSLTHSVSASHSHTPTKSPFPEESPSMSSSLPASQVSLQVAILNATNSSVALESLHKLLASPSINQMLFSGDEHLERAAQDSAMLQDLSDHIPALVMLDLMCSSSVDGQLAKRIIEQATSRCQEMLKASHSRGELSKRGARTSQAHDIMLSGPFVLLQIIADVASSFVTPTNHQYPTITPHSSPHSLFTKFTHHLRVSTIANAKAHMDLYHTSREKVEGVLDQSQNELKPTATIFTELSPSSPNDDSSQLQFQADMFDDLIRTLSGNMHSPSLPSSPRNRSLMRQSSLNGSRHSTSSYDCPSALSVSYLKQFSRYLAKLVELLIKCLGTGTSNLSKGSLFQLVLKESPSHLLGKLVFEQGIKPQKLENMKGDFPHLRIVEVLVKCCCPQLPSLAAASIRAVPATPPVVALNSGEASGEDWDTLNPCAFSYKLLSKVVSILKDGAYSSLYQDGVLTSDDLISVLKNPELRTAFSKTPLLANIDLNHLDTPSKQMIFYSNITNLLYIHALITYFTVATSNEGVEQGTSPLHGAKLVGEVLRNCSNDITSCMLHSDKLVRMVYFTKVGYNIGQLGLVSCFDLHYSILRQSLTPPAWSKGNSLETRLSAEKPDPWATFAPQSPDPRVLFIIHNSFLSSPFPKAITEKDFDECLKSAENVYLNSTVTVDVSKREISVPQWLYDNQADLVKQVWNEATSSTTSQLFYPELALFKYIYSKLDREKSDMLKPLLETVDSGKGRKLSVTVQPENVKFGYNFNLKKSSGTSGVRTSPKARRKRLARQVSHKEATASVVKSSGSPAKYTFTPETMAFVKGQAPLLAALVQLLCPPPGMGLHEDESLGEDGSETAGSRDDQDGHGGRKSLKQSIRKSKPSTPTPKKPLPQSFDDGLLPSPWRRQFDKILAHFSSFPPMKHYLTARLSCFESQLKWDSQSTGQKSPETPTTPSGTKSPTETSREKQQEELQHTTLRRMAALSASSPELGEACSFVLRQLLESGQAGEALKFLASEPACSHLLKLEYLKDVVISSAFVELKMTIVVQNPVSMLSQLSDPELAVRLAFSSLSKWPVNTCVDVLTYFANHLPPTSIYMSPVSKKLEKMTVYSRVLSTCESPLPSYQRPSAKSPWKSWAELAGDSTSKPDYVLGILLASKVYSLVRKWVDVHELGSEFVQQIEVDYLFDLLEGSTPDSITAHQVLDSISDDKEKLKVCEALLKDADLQTTIFVLHYMLTRLPHCIPIAKNQDYCNRLLGAKALLSLPKSYQKHYEQLVAHPMLLVEQLVINLKIDWAGTVIQQLRSSEYLPNISKLDAPILEHTPMVMEREESGDPFTKLLMFYSSKALEFPQPIMIQSTPAQSLAASAYPTRPPSPGGSQRFGIPRTPSRNVPPGDQADPFSPRRESLSKSGRKRGSMSVMSPTPLLTEVRSAGLYEPPPTPPTKECWEKNAEVASCRACNQVTFGMFSRRHHCRRCGRVVCAGCSSNTASVKRYDTPVRVCDDCFPFCTSLSLGQNEDSPSQAFNASVVATSPHDTMGYASFSVATQTVKLIPHDLHFNQQVRTEFYFERTPDTALCLSLIDMIVNKRVAAAFILDCCHSVSLQLVPDSQGRVNEEVDHYFVIGLIQNLLLNAKLRYADTNDSSGVELCDTYLSRVDLLRLLVSSRYSKIPSIQELTKPDLARRVRDSLLQDDRFGLAMEVSTKCQLDTSVVWSAWGMACLKIGNFSNARNKFQLCFQVSSQSKLSSSGGQNLSLLHRIIEQIENNPLSITGRNTQYSEEWKSVVVGSMALSEKRSDECDLDIYRFNECVYYLRTYGTHSTMVAFFVKHNCWMDACKYTLDMKCPTEIFVDHIWVPAFKTGLIETAEDCLTSLDSSLAAWEVYLTAACRFFTQRGLFSVLYRTQLFMQDYVRAALTCIKFYIGFAGRSTTISDLYSRLHYLASAKRHFQDALDIKTREQSRGGRSKGLRQYEEFQRRGGGSGTKSIPVSELETHLLTVSMQAKVTKFLYGCSEAKGTLGEPLIPPTSSGGAEGGLTSGAGRGRTTQQVPTLFGSGHTRGEVVVQLLICSQDVVEGYQLAREIIQFYKLPPSKVYCDVSRNLALKQRYNEIRVLLQCIQKSTPKHSSFDALNDEIIMTAIKILASQTKEAKQVDKLVQLLTNDRSKIKAFVQCGKLKNAYLVAIKSSTPLVDEVRNISEIAGKAGQLPVKDICDKWLQRKATESPSYR